MNKRISTFFTPFSINQVLLRTSMYRNAISRESVEKKQLDKFNAIWKDAYINLQFYKNWKAMYSLPDSISTLRELEGWPIITKQMLQIKIENLQRDTAKVSTCVFTGGSTGEPLRLPTWSDRFTSSSQWIGRVAYGVMPGDRTFLLWGHHHLYGKGIKRKINQAKRKIKDTLLNMCRVSAYDLSEDAMGRAFNTYKEFKPQFVIGFSASVLAFCRINSLCKISHAPKAVLCTAGPLSNAEKEEIECFFKAPVCMEYGSVEAGVMAYTEPETQHYRVFWDTHLLQGFTDETGETRNIVTRLTPCYFPLIRYDIGDCLDLLDTTHMESIYEINTVKGRPSDIIQLKNGVSFFGAIIGDCVKQVPAVVASQLIVLEEAIFEIHVVARQQLADIDFDLIKNRLKLVVKGLENDVFKIKQVDKLIVTQGGKIPLVIRV